MQILIDDKQYGLKEKHSDIDSLVGELINAVGSDRMIGGLRINDADFSINDADRYKNLDTISSISVKTASIKNMLIESVESSREILDSLETISKAAIEMFRLGREMEGNKLLEGLIYFLEYFISNVDILGALLIKINKNPSEVFSEEYKRKLLDTLTELKDSQLNMDDIMIADLIEYEMMPIFKKVNQDMGSYVKSLS